MRACILASANTSDTDIMALNRLADIHGYNTSDVIKATMLSVVGIIDKIRAGQYRRVYIQSETHLARVATKMIALTVILDDLEISLINQRCRAITDSYLIETLERELSGQFKNAQLGN